MQDLHLVGITTDRRGLIFSTREGARSGSFVVPVDEDLRGILDELTVEFDHDDATNDGSEDELPGTRSTEEPGERVEALLSVREVQARIRAGEALDDIARAAGVGVDWVERFAPPVRAEQRRVVDRAMGAHLERSRAGLSARPLADAVASGMADKRISFTAATFDAAWSARLVGVDHWVVGFRYHHRNQDRVLEWDFDVATGSLTTTDRVASQIAFVAPSDDHAPPAKPPAKASSAPRPSARGPKPTVDPDEADAAVEAPIAPTKGAAAARRAEAQAEAAEAARVRRKAAAKKAATMKRAAERAAEKKRESAKRAAAKKAAKAEAAAEKRREDQATAAEARREAAAAKAAADEAEAARVAAAQIEAARVEADRVEAGRVEAARVEAARVEAARAAEAAQEEVERDRAAAEAAKMAAEIAAAKEQAATESATDGSTDAAVDAEAPSSSDATGESVPPTTAPADGSPRRPRVRARLAPSPSPSANGTPPDADARIAARRARAVQRTTATVQFRSGSASPVRPASEDADAAPASGVNDEGQDASAPEGVNPDGSARPRRRRQLRAT